jgi:putative photosynthetic complex assembly protein 2
MSRDIALAAAYAVLVWWSTTGIILFLDGLARATFRWSLAAAGAVLVGALYGLHLGAYDTSPAGAYTCFSCAILVWAWLEMSFLMGFITGPRKHACADNCRGWRHFLHATQAILYNEIATLAAAALVCGLTWQGLNRTGLWTFLVLWVMRLSAKLNLFLGVPNCAERFLPEHLQYLTSFFKKRPMNFLFPLSVSGSTIAAVLLIQKCLAAEDVFQATGDALVASLLALAVLEHWFMVLPWSSEKLWAFGSHARLEPRIAVKAPSEC